MPLPAATLNGIKFHFLPGIIFIKSYYVLVTLELPTHRIGNYKGDIVTDSKQIINFITSPLAI